MSLYDPVIPSKRPPILVLPIGVRGCLRDALVHSLRGAGVFDDHIFVVSGQALTGRQTERILILSSSRDQEETASTLAVHEEWLDYIKCRLRPGGTMIRY